MSSVSVVIVVVLAIFAASMLGAWLRGGAVSASGGGSQGNVEGVREEMQRLLTAQAQGFSSQIGQVTQLVTQELASVRQELEQGVASTGRITVDAQREITEQLRNSTDVLGRLNEHLGKMQESGKELTQAAQTMQTVLGGPKSRGVLGEAQLEGLLADVLPRTSYEIPYEFPGGATAAAALHAGKKLIAVDSEFPIDSYRDVAEKGDGARPQFATAVRERVDKIAENLIAPDEGTLDLALMFVPSESAYYEVLVTADKNGRLDDYCRQKHVLPVSPNSLHGYLSAILVGLKGTESEENARRMLARLDEVKGTFEGFAKVHAELGEQLQKMRLNYEDASQQLQRALAKFGETASSAAEEERAEKVEEPEQEEARELAPTATSNNGA